MLSAPLRRYKAFAIENQISPIFPIQVDPLLRFLKELKQSNRASSLRVVCNCLRHYPGHDKAWFKEVFQHPKVLESLGITNRRKMRFVSRPHERKVVKATKVANIMMHEKLPNNYNNWLNEILEPIEKNSNTEKKKKAIHKKKSLVQSEPTLYISIPNAL